MRLKLAAAFALVMASTASAQTLKVFNREWVDANYVPCKGVGASASGQIKVRVQHERWGAGIPEDGIPPNWYHQVWAIHVDTHYIHAHKPSATLTYRTPNTPLGPGRIEKITLRQPWFQTMSATGDGWMHLVGPRANAAYRWPNHRQEPFMVADGSTLTLDVSTLFPRNGGNCTSSFRQTFRLS